MGDRQRHGRAAICGQLRAAVKAEPANPQHCGADHDVAGIVRRCGFVFACAEEKRQDQSGQTSGFVHNNAAGKISDANCAQKSTVAQHAAAPNPVHHRCIAQQHPQARKGHHKGKANAFNISAHNQCRCDDRKSHLKGKEQNFGEGAAQAVGCHAGQEHFVQSTPEAAGAAAKGN